VYELEKVKRETKQSESSIQQYSPELLEKYNQK